MFKIRLSFKVHDNRLEAFVDHASGQRLISISSNEPVIRQYLFSSRDASAAINLAKIIVDRCMQFGINQLKYLKDPSVIDSLKV